MSRLSADQLQTFVTIIEYGTFEAAADILGVSAPAISQRVKTMERIAGQVLLRRTNPIEPTAAGENILRIARQSEYLQQELERALVGSTGHRTISIAVNADSLATWFMEAVRALAVEESIYCQIRREGEFQSSALLRSGEVMGAITSDPHPIAGCSWEPLRVMKYWVVASAEFVQRHFPDFPRVSLAQLDAAPVLEYDRQDYGYHRARQLLEAQYGINSEESGSGATERTPAPRLYVPSSPDYARAVEAGCAWGVLPWEQCEKGLSSGELVALVDEPFEVQLYWQHWNIDSPLLANVTESIRRAADMGQDS